MRLQTLRNAAVGAHARSTDPALILLAGVGASFDFDFNDYLHIASLSALPQPCATARNVQNPDLVHFPLGNFLASSVIIVSPVSVNRLRAHNKPIQKWDRALTGTNKALKKKAIIAVARRLFIDIWRIRTGRTTAQEVGLILSNE